MSEIITCIINYTSKFCLFHTHFWDLWWFLCVSMTWNTFEIIWSKTTPCPSNPVGTAWLAGENAKFSGVRSSSKFSTGEIRKPTGDTTKPTREDMKIQRGELMNIMLWLKNIYTWFTLKHINGWVTFKCQKILRKIALAMISSLKVYNRIQYTNHHMNNAVTHQIYPRKSQYISLEQIFDMIYETKVSLSPGLVYPLSYVML